MLLGPIIILDYKLGIALQTAQAYGTVFLDPSGLAVLHFDGIHRAVLSAQAIANAGILHMEMAGLTQTLIEVGVDHFHKLAQLVIHMVAINAHLDFTNDTVLLQSLKNSSSGFTRILHIPHNNQYG